MADRKSVMRRLANAQGFFEARADMAVGDGKMVLASWAKAQEEAIEMLKAQEGGWISVTDRLPETGGKYLICAVSNGEQRITTAYYGRSFYLTGRIAYWKVTHWMPLPDMPEEG